MLLKYIKKFFGRVEDTPVPTTDEAMIDGKAFAIKHYPLRNPVSVLPDDTLVARLTENDEEVAEITEPVNVSMTIDTISLIRFNDALGFKHAVGAIFGQRKDYGKGRIHDQ